MPPDQSTVTNESGTDQSPPPPGLIDYLAVILKRKKFIIRVTLAAAVLAILYSLLLPNIYTAKTLILPAQEDKGMMSAMLAQMGGLASMAIGTGTQLGGPTTAELYVSMLKSEAVKDPIIDRFKLMDVYKNKYRTDTYRVMDKKAVITAGKKDGIITIAYSEKDPKMAADIANAYVDELGKLAVRLNVAGAGKNRNFLEERLTGARADLAKAEDDLKAFQAKNKAVQVPAQAEATIKGVAELRAQLAVQEVQLATYRRQFTDSSQEVKSLLASVGNLRAQIARLEGSGGSSSIPSVGSVPALGQEYVRLMREFKIQESLVELLTKQYELAKYSEAKDVAPIQVIQKARVPERKSRPMRSKIVAIAFMASFLLSAVFALSFDSLHEFGQKLRKIKS